jgi:hypothetical protein
MDARRLQDALKRLDDAIREVSRLLEQMRGGRDPLALHIFLSRRYYQRIAENDGKGGKRSERTATASWLEACKLGFRGTLFEWQRLMGAPFKRD